MFERAPEEVLNSESQLLEDGWGAAPRFVSFMAEVEGAERPVGFALCYFAYSTWKGTCLYLEDLYVAEAHRAAGVGMALMHRCVKEAKERKCKRVQWQALDWSGRGNTLACSELSIKTILCELALTARLLCSLFLVLFRNASALAFYNKLGAAEMREWIPLRFDEQAIGKFLDKFSPSYISL